MNQRIYSVESFRQRRVSHVRDSPGDALCLGSCHVNRDDLADLVPKADVRAAGLVKNTDGVIGNTRFAAMK